MLTGAFDSLINRERHFADFKISHDFGLDKPNARYVSTFGFR